MKCHNKARYEDIKVMHINPDYYLETMYGRIWTEESNQYAWQQCLDDYLAQLNDHPEVKIVYLLIGCQGAGKSSWAAIKKKQEPQNIIFDAILVKRSERKPLIEYALMHDKICVAIYFTTDLKECLIRNSHRRLEERVNETALINVYSALEKPSHNEGFSSIIQV